jgi:hypothetical protein
LIFLKKQIGTVFTLPASTTHFKQTHIETHHHSPVNDEYEPSFLAGWATPATRMESTLAEVCIRPAIHLHRLVLEGAKVVLMCLL